MNLLADLATWSLLAFAALLFLAQTAAREVGFVLGRRSAAKAGAGARYEGVGVVVGSILGLLVFVLALTLSASSARYAERRSGALEEANAIGTAWLQATAINDDRSIAIAGLLGEYAAERVAYIHADRGADDIDAAMSRTLELQTEIWGLMSALIQSRVDPATVSLMNALNHVFDMTTAQRFAITQELPPPLIWLLFSFTIVGMVVLGYQLGLIGRPNRILATVMAILWTAVIVQVLDMGSARIGRFRTDDRPYLWTMDGFTALPVPATTP